MTMAFDGYIAIDWSGADGRYAGISVARCAPGRAAPRLVAPEAARWSRTAVAAWLDAELQSGRRLLIGFDFAFGMPFEPGLGYLAGAAPHATEAFDLWDLIDAASGEAEDFGCAPMIADPRFAALYWWTGRQPSGWCARQRQAEIVCGTATATHPECVFKLIGAKQVGKASLTGIRVLRAVRVRNRSTVTVWPFERTNGMSAMVEIYPTLFRKDAVGSVVKLRDRAALNAALRRLGSRPAAGSAALSDHDTDALISAAGLREYIERRGYGLRDVAEPIRREGWIFGVPLPTAARPTRDAGLAAAP